MTKQRKNNNGWTEERRRKQAESIKKWKPWEKSTGPLTEMGKRRSSMNAIISGEFSPLLIEYDHILRLSKAVHQQCLKVCHLDDELRVSLMRMVRLRKKAAKNELMNEINKINGINPLIGGPPIGELMDAASHEQDKINGGGGNSVA